MQRSGARVEEVHKAACGRCIGSRPKRFLQMRRCLENLSSGEKRAGCADSVGLPSGVSFCKSESGEEVGSQRQGEIREAKSEQVL